MKQKFEIQHIDELESLGNIVAGYTLGDKQDWPFAQDNALAQYDSFAHAIGFKATDLVRVKQKHTTRVMIADITNKGEGVAKHEWLEPADGIITNTPHVVLCVLTADCTPVFLVDTKTHAIALVHSGWRGTVAHISQIAVQKMQKQFGSKPKNIVAYLGPHICKNCFEFSATDTEQLKDFARSPYIVEDENSVKTGKVHIDTNACIRTTLLNCGLSNNNIFECAECSFESAGRLASYRRKPIPKTRTLSFLAISAPAVLSS